MSIETKDYKEYVPLNAAEWNIKLREFEQLFSFYVDSMGIDIKDIVCNKESIIEIIDRVEKRRVYFKIFYSKDMSERNEASLYCFWIIKLLPFFNKKNPEHRINISFATFLFLRMITYNNMRKKPPKKINISESYLKHLLYAFTFRDISKESIMAIAETISS